jgi:hypothetical protein
MTLVALGLVLFLPMAASAQDKATPEGYSAVAMGTGGSVGGKSLPFDFRVTQYTTEDELQTYAQLLKDKGTDALMKVLEKEDRGRVNPVGSTGTQIAIATKRQVGEETVITIVTARNMSFYELYRSGRTTDYPYSYIQVKLDASGKGAGQIMAAAKLKFDKKKGQYVIESYGNQYIKAVNVRPH